MALVPIAATAAVIAAAVAIAVRGHGPQSRAGQGAAGDIATVALTDQGAGDAADDSAKHGVAAGVVAITVAIGLGGGGGGRQHRQSDRADADLGNGLHGGLLSKAG
ncbi:hypothetical protein D3C87_1789460 [compost metagenome]